MDKARTTDILATVGEFGKPFPGGAVEAYINTAPSPLPSPTEPTPPSFIRPTYLTPPAAVRESLWKRALGAVQQTPSHGPLIATQDGHVTLEQITQPV